MNLINDPKKANLMDSVFWGVMRGIFVHTLIYPFEVIKIRQQCLSTPEKSYRVAWGIFQKEGMHPFYNGLPFQLLKTGLKQVWCWPMITGTPIFLSRYNIGNLCEQALTGVAISTIEAVVTTPLERAKILAALTGKNVFSLKSVYKDGWRGFATHWVKASVNWSVFLVTQKFLRDRYHKKKDKLSFPQLIEIGVQVAVIVGLVSAPFDIANTLKQARNHSVFSLLSKKTIRGFYRGWPLSTLSLMIHNVASVIVIDNLGNKSTGVKSGG